MQGVGFRATVGHLAERFDVTGWVRNQPDGTVRLEAQGDATEIDGLTDAVAERMERFIENWTAEPMQPAEGEKGFEIRG